MSLQKSKKEIAIGSAFFKRTNKLIPCQKEMIIYWRERGSSLSELGAMFKVSKRTIQFIIDPEKYAANLLVRKMRGGSNIYYDKEKHTIATKKSRHYKKQLFGYVNIKT
jgi:transposase